MLGDVDKTSAFWQEVWASRLHLPNVAKHYGVPVSAVDSPETQFFNEQLFLEKSKAKAYWAWQSVLLYCSRVLELMLALQLQQAQALIQGLLTIAPLWEALAQEAKRDPALKKTLSIFTTVAQEDLSDSAASTLEPAYDIRYWRPAIDYAREQVWISYKMQFKQSWYRWFTITPKEANTGIAEAKYLAYSRALVASYDQKTQNRWSSWHRFVGWLYGIKDKRRLLALHDLSNKLSSWVQSDALPSSVEVNDALAESSELKVSSSTKRLRKLALIRHQQQGKAMIDSLGEEMNGYAVHNSVTSAFLQQCQPAYEQKAIALIQQSFAHWQTKGIAHESLLQPIEEMSKIYQLQLKQRLSASGVSAPGVLVEQSKLLTLQHSVHGVLLALTEQFYPLLLQLQALTQRLHYSAAQSLDASRERYQEYMNYLNQNLLPKYNTLVQEAYPKASNSIVFASLIQEFKTAWSDQIHHHQAHAQAYKLALEEHTQMMRLKAIEHDLNRWQSTWKKPLSNAVDLYHSQEKGIKKSYSTAKSRLNDAQEVKDREFKEALIEKYKKDDFLWEYSWKKEGDVKFDRELSKGSSELGKAYWAEMKKLSEIPLVSYTKILAEMSQTVLAAHANFPALEAYFRLRLSCEFRTNSIDPTCMDIHINGIETWFFYPRPQNHFLFYLDKSCTDKYRQWHILGRDSRGNIHRIQVDLRKSPWSQHYYLLRRISKQDEAQLQSDAMSKVDSFPLLETLSQVVNEQLFEFSAHSKAQPIILNHVSQYYQDEMHHVYVKCYLPALEHLLKAEAKLDDLRINKVSPLLKKCSDRGVALSTWAAVSRSMFKGRDNVLTPLSRSYLENPCQDIEVYDPEQQYTEAENYDSLFFQARTWFWFQYFELKMQLYHRIRDHQDDDLDIWCNAVLGDADLQTALRELIKCRNRMAFHIHPDRLGNLNLILPEERIEYHMRLMRKFMVEAEKSCKELEKLIPYSEKSLANSGFKAQYQASLESFILEDYLRTLDGAALKRQMLSDSDAHFQILHQKWYEGGSLLKDRCVNYRSYLERMQKIQLRIETGIAKQEKERKRAEQERAKREKERNRADQEKAKREKERKRADAETQRADAATQRADAATQRADAETQRADAEIQRAETAEAENRRLRAVIAAMQNKPQTDASTSATEDDTTAAAPRGPGMF